MNYKLVQLFKAIPRDTPTHRRKNPMKNERMYQELIELLTTDSAAGKENAIADKLTEKMET